MRVHDTRAHTACTERANCRGPGAVRARRRAAAGVRLTPTLQEHSWHLHLQGPPRRGARLLAGVHGHEQPAPVEHDIERVRRGPRGHADEVAGLGGALAPKLEHLRTRQPTPLARYIAARAMHAETAASCCMRCADTKCAPTLLRAYRARQGPRPDRSSVPHSTPCRATVAHKRYWSPALPGRQAGRQAGRQETLHRQGAGDRRAHEAATSLVPLVTSLSPASSTQTPLGRNISRPRDASKGASPSQSPAGESMYWEPSHDCFANSALLTDASTSDCIPPYSTLHTHAEEGGACSAERMLNHSNAGAPWKWTPSQGSRTLWQDARSGQAERSGQRAFAARRHPEQAPSGASGHVDVAGRLRPAPAESVSRRGCCRSRSTGRIDGVPALAQPGGHAAQSAGHAMARSRTAAARRSRSAAPTLLRLGTRLPCVPSAAASSQAARPGQGHGVLVSYPSRDLFHHKSPSRQARAS